MVQQNSGLNKIKVSFLSSPGLVWWLCSSGSSRHPGSSTLWLCLPWSLALPPLYHLQRLTTLSKTDTVGMTSFHRDHSGESLDSGRRRKVVNMGYISEGELKGPMEMGWVWNLQIQEEPRTTAIFLTKHSCSYRLTVSNGDNTIESTSQATPLSAPNHPHAFPFCRTKPTPYTTCQALSPDPQNHLMK